MRNLKIAFVAIALTSLLAGCSATPSANSVFDGIKPACQKMQGGAEIDTVKVTAEDGKVPSVDFVTTDKKTGTVSPLTKIKATQTKVITEGSGPEYTGDQQLTIEFAVFNASNGSPIGSTSWNGTDASTEFFNSTDSADFCNAITGVKEGSLVAFATPVSEEDPNGSLFVIKITKIFLPHANGEEKAPEAGFPQVVRDPKTGQPGLIKPSFGPSKTFKRAILIEGRGDSVKTTDTVLVHYSGWIWNDALGSKFDSSWENGKPVSLTLSQTVPGFSKALDGVKVGSQVIAILPPDEAYGTTGNSSIPPNSTLVFVIDVIDITK